MVDLRNQKFERESKLQKKTNLFLISKKQIKRFSTLKSYSFDKVDKILSEMESIALKTLLEFKDLVTQNVSKGDTVVITKHTKYLEGIKSLLSDSSKLKQLPNDQVKSKIILSN